MATVYNTTDTSITEREKLIYLAKLAEQGERYDEMASFMQQVAEIATDELSVEERNLLSVAFKNAVGARRASLRIVSSVEQKHKKRKENSPHGQLATKYRESVEKELCDFCFKILKLIDEHFLLMESITAESRVFYYKMKGDYYRYLSEFNPTEKPDEIEKARSSYDQASVIAEENLTPTHPIRLGLALNFSVFYFEILSNSTTACTMAQQAFDEAIKALDLCVESHYRDSTLIMQLLRDNLTLWQSDASGEPVLNEQTTFK